MLIGPQNSRSGATIAARLAAVRAGMAEAARAAGRTVDSITLVAVSKGQAAPALREAGRAGATDFGESYLQEALPKLDALADLRATWHFIGRIQTNKTRSIAERFDWAHGVDRLKIAERLALQRPPQAAPLNICIQVNIAGEAGKAGVKPAQTRELVRSCVQLPQLTVRGLMCILPDALTQTAQQTHFAALRQLLVDLNRDGARLEHLSMGMSGDYPAAIAAGATLVRIGSAIFGSRNSPPATRAHPAVLG